MKTRQLFAVFGLIFVLLALVACGQNSSIGTSTGPNEARGTSEPVETESEAEPTATRPAQSGITILADGPCRESLAARSAERNGNSPPQHLL